MKKRKASLVLFLQACLCSSLYSGLDWGQLRGILKSIAKENKFTLTGFNLPGNKLSIYLHNPDNNHGKILLSSSKESEH